MLVQERGIDFEPTDDYLQEVRLAGGEDELISALQSAKVTKPATVDPAAEARQTEVKQHVARGAEYFQSKRYADAETEFRAALRLAPQDSDLHVGLGRVLGSNGDWDGAIREYREALRLNPDNADAHANLGGVLGFRGDLDGAIAEAREALHLDPNDCATRCFLGAALEGKGDDRGALREYRAAYMLDPKKATCKQNYERLLQQMNK
jgi:Flp pilus assembly protein TadD